MNMYAQRAVRLDATRSLRRQKFKWNVTWALPALHCSASCFSFAVPPCRCSLRFKSGKIIRAAHKSKYKNVCNVKGRATGADGVGRRTMATAPQHPAPPATRHAATTCVTRLGLWLGPSLEGRLPAARWPTPQGPGRAPPRRNRPHPPIQEPRAPRAFIF